jgi:hypothetical protein
MFGGAVPFFVLAMAGPCMRVIQDKYSIEIRA